MIVPMRYGSKYFSYMFNDPHMVNLNILFFDSWNKYFLLSNIGYSILLSAIANTPWDIFDTWTFVSSLIHIGDVGIQVYVFHAFLKLYDPQYICYQIQQSWGRCSRYLSHFICFFLPMISPVFSPSHCKRNKGIATFV